MECNKIEFDNERERICEKFQSKRLKQKKIIHQVIEDKKDENDQNEITNKKHYERDMSNIKKQHDKYIIQVKND